MANDLNQCTFIGRLGQDVDVRYTQQGKAVASASLAVGEVYKDANGQKVENTEWVNLSAWGKLAENMGNYLAKGSRICVTGKMKTEKWQDQTGQDRYTTKIVVSNLQMLDPKPQGQNNQQNGYQQQNQGQQSPQQQQGYRQQAPQQQPANMPEPPEDLDDDIPF
ncbi:MAG: single-stranded DNA-binding protein [Pseudomonadales bacterium]|nr:single-stranded DNA-binding protein [Pseudomonadales bacterium]